MIGLLVKLTPFFIDGAPRGSKCRIPNLIHTTTCSSVLVLLVKCSSPLAAVAVFIFGSQECRRDIAPTRTAKKKEKKMQRMRFVTLAPPETAPGRSLWTHYAMMVRPILRIVLDPIACWLIAFIILESVLDLLGVICSWLTGNWGRLLIYWGCTSFWFFLIVCM